jgi:hypothetical protein
MRGDTTWASGKAGREPEEQQPDDAGPEGPFPEVEQPRKDEAPADRPSSASGSRKVARKRMPKRGIVWLSMNREPTVPTRYPRSVFLKPFMPMSVPSRMSSTRPVPAPTSIATGGGEVRP